MYKYLMKDPRTDYRLGTDGESGVLHTHQEGWVVEDGVRKEIVTAFGNFAVIDDDMVECAAEEIAWIEKIREGF